VFRSIESELFIMNVQINETICNELFLFFLFFSISNLENNNNNNNVIALYLIFACVHVDN
jgi:hypothetical protein